MIEFWASPPNSFYKRNKTEERLNAWWHFVNVSMFWVFVAEPQCGHAPACNCVCVSAINAEFIYHQGVPSVTLACSKMKWTLMGKSHDQFICILTRFHKRNIHKFSCFQRDHFIAQYNTYETSWGAVFSFFGHQPLPWILGFLASKCSLCSHTNWNKKCWL